MPNDPSGPQSPDQLGVHGRVEGVTRIGGRAIFLGILILAALIGGIIYGLNGNKSSQQAAAPPTPPVAPPPPVAQGPHFGADVPIVETPPPETPPPAVLLPPSAPPLNEASATPPGGGPNVAPSGPSAAEIAEEKRLDAERQRELDAEKAREDELRRANQAPILLAGVGNGSGGGFTGGPGPATLLASAGAPGTTGAAGTTGASGPSGPSGPAGAAGAAGSSGSAPGAAGAAPGAGGGAAGAAPGGATAASGPTPNPALAYLAGPTGQFASTAYNLQSGAYSHNNLPSSRYAPATIFELLAGSVMPAELITGIDSEQPGLVTGQIREDVYDSKSGRYLLIPKGSRLIGVYSNGGSYGTSRVQVAWQRLIFPDTSSIDLLQMSGADVQGGGGLGGKVDNHTGTLIIGTLLSSVLAAGLALSQPTTTVVSTTQGTVAVPSQGALAAQGVGQQLTQTTQGLIQKNLNQPPTVYVPRGYPFLVVVDRDMIFPGPYGPSFLP
jgi:type IV secretion system protein VirB10